MRNKLKKESDGDDQRKRKEEDGKKVGYFVERRTVTIMNTR